MSFVLGFFSTRRLAHKHPCIRARSLFCFGLILRASKQAYLANVAPHSQCAARSSRIVTRASSWIHGAAPMPDGRRLCSVNVWSLFTNASASPPWLRLRGDVPSCLRASVVTCHPARVPLWLSAILPACLCGDMPPCPRASVVTCHPACVPLPDRRELPSPHFWAVRPDCQREDHVAAHRRGAREAEELRLRGVHEAGGCCPCKGGDGW